MPEPFDHLVEVPEGLHYLPGSEPEFERELTSEGSAVLMRTVQRRCARADRLSLYRWAAGHELPTAPDQLYAKIDPDVLERNWEGFLSSVAAEAIHQPEPTGEEVICVLYHVRRIVRAARPKDLLVWIDDKYPDASDEAWDAVRPGVDAQAIVNQILCEVARPLEEEEGEFRAMVRAMEGSA
jgi:hypothetical protein